MLITRSHDNITWECSNGGKLWTISGAGTSSVSLPTAFCSLGFAGLNAAFIISLLVDIFCQVSVLHHLYIPPHEIARRFTCAS